MANQHNILLQKLDQFTRKFYLNQLIKGGIYFVLISLSTWILASTLEYYGHFSQSARTLLFFALAAVTLGVAIPYLIKPLLGLYKIGKSLDYDQAAVIVGKHFPNISDKLLNTLQLGRNAEQLGNDSLLLASIEQKTTELKPLPFQQAIDLKKNIKYLRFLFYPVGALVLLLLIAPGFTDSTKRIIQYNKHFEIEAPFQFNLINKETQIAQNDDYLVEMKIEGQVIPAESYILIDGNRFKMKNLVSGNFEFQLRNLQDSKEIKFEADGFESDKYPLTVVPKPTLLNFKAALKYPKYLNKKDETLTNASDLTLPEGTEIQWVLNTKNVDRIEAQLLDKPLKVEQNQNTFSFQKVFSKSSTLAIKQYNSRLASPDSFLQNIRVVADQHPEISVQPKNDSSSNKILYLLGKIQDDYGFTQLTFNYSITKIKGDSKNGTTAININKGSSKQAFYHYWDLSKMAVEPGDEISYSFTVWDNDGVQGPKATKSKTFVYNAPTVDQINAETDKSNSEIKDKLSESKKESDNLDKKIDDIQQKLTEKKNLSWEEKQEIKKLLEQQKQLQKQMEEVVKQNKEKNAKESEFKDLDQEILEKQQELEKLFEETLDDETKELMEKIQKLLEEDNKEELQENLKDFKLEKEKLNKEMERMLELFKQLEMEKKVKESIKKLEDLADKQEKLAEKTDQLDKKDKEGLEKAKNEQKKLNEEFKKLREELNENEKKNQDLEKPLNLEKTEEQEEEIEKEQEESLEKMEQQQKDQATPKQKNAGEKMKKMAQKMKSQMQSMEMKQQMEDYNTLRQILENLIQVSYDQEELINEFKRLYQYNPRYVELAQKQRKIKDDTKIIEDSLYALAKRQVQIKKYVTDEIADINGYLGDALYALSERQTRMALTDQQKVMTGYNNLAVMLSEILKNMQQQMSSMSGSSSGNKQCNNPKKSGKKPNMKTLKQMQGELAKQLEALKKEQGQGKKPGSKGFAEAAAKQAAIRKKMGDLKQQLDKEGKGNKMGDLNRTDQLMDDIEKDLVNKRLNNSTIEKMRELELRLLEHEKAEQEQEQEQKRQSNEGVNKQRELPPSIQEYLKQKEKEQELLKTLPPDLSPYYRQRTRDYFEELSQ